MTATSALSSKPTSMLNRFDEVDDPPDVVENVTLSQGADDEEGEEEDDSGTEEDQMNKSLKVEDGTSFRKEFLAKIGAIHRKKVVESGSSFPVTTSARRADVSLNMLSQSFIQILRAAPGGKLDLRDAHIVLDLRQKRRLYDITGVLEGVGLIEKISKNVILWKGEGCAESTIPVQHKTKRRHIQENVQWLREREEELDRLIECGKYNVRTVLEMKTNKPYLYVTREELLKTYPSDQQLLVLKDYGDLLFIPQNVPSGFDPETSHMSFPATMKAMALAGLRGQGVPQVMAIPKKKDWPVACFLVEDDKPVNTGESHSSEAKRRKISSDENSQEKESKSTVISGGLIPMTPYIVEKPTKSLLSSVEGLKDLFDDEQVP